MDGLCSSSDKRNFTTRVPSHWRNVANILTVSLFCFPSGSRSDDKVMTFSPGDSLGMVSYLAIQFFDDEELVLILEHWDAATSMPQRYLATLRYAAIQESMTALPGGHLGENWRLSDYTPGVSSEVNSLI